MGGMLEENEPRLNRPNTHGDYLLPRRLLAVGCPLSAQAQR